MKRKLGNFKILKLSSARLKQYKYHITLSYADAIKNNEIISLGENELIYAIQSLTGTPTDFKRVSEINVEKKRVGRLKNSDAHRASLSLLNAELQDLTFIKQLVSVQFSDKRHYQNILDGGLFINGKEYVRFIAGAGNIRRNTVMFVDKELFDALMGVLDNGRNVNVELNAAKYNAYFGLYASSGHRVSTPTFAVIPDCKIERRATLNWIDNADTVSVEEKDVVLNAFDGQGLISPRLAEVWARELEIDYIPSTFIIRAPFVKGQVVVFDYHQFASVEQKNLAEDVWGNVFSINDTDLILSESQFKLLDAYGSLQEYISAMEDRDLGFRVSRYSPLQLRMDTSSNYMFIQSLDLDDDDINALVEGTIGYFRDIQMDDPLKTALYLGGTSIFSSSFVSDDFYELDILSRAILSYPPLLTEKYISDRIKYVLAKKTKQAKMGKLIFRGNYAPMVSDPYAQAQVLCGLKPRGLLGEDEHYSGYWNNEGVDVVAAARSPLTHTSEMQKFKLVDRAGLREWYKYLDNTVFILPHNAMDVFYLADADLNKSL